MLVDMSYLVSGFEFHKLAKWSFCHRYPLSLDMTKIDENDIVFLNLEGRRPGRMWWLWQSGLQSYLHYRSLCYLCRRCSTDVFRHPGRALAPRAPRYCHSLSE